MRKLEMFFIIVLVTSVQALKALSAAPSRTPESGQDRTDTSSQSVITRRMSWGGGSLKGDRQSGQTDTTETPLTTDSKWTPNSVKPSRRASWSGSASTRSPVLGFSANLLGGGHETPGDAASETPDDQASPMQEETSPEYPETAPPPPQVHHPLFSTTLSQTQIAITRQEHELQVLAIAEKHLAEIVTRLYIIAAVKQALIPLKDAVTSLQTKQEQNIGAINSLLKAGSLLPSS